MSPTVIDFGDDAVELLPERAAFCHSGRNLLIADLHLGKECHFRRHGVPVPDGSSAECLMNLQKLIDAHEPLSVSLLGDIFHSRRGLSNVLLGMLSDFIARNKHLQFDLIQGNHDRHCDSVFSAYGARWLPALHLPSGIRLVHSASADSEVPTIQGHIHPVFSVPIIGRLPCFWISGHVLTLPSFGPFTGGAKVLRSQGDQVFVATQTCVIEVKESTFEGRVHP